MIANSRLMEGKRGLIMGVANDRSIAWGIANALAQHGAELAFTYQGDIMKERVQPLAESVGSKLVMPCDVIDDISMDNVFSEIDKTWGKMDFLVHSIAFARKSELANRYVDSVRKDFLRSMDVSCYSFTNLAKRSEPLMKNGGSLLALSYYGAEKVIPHYNTMGVAKAALEASVKYLAADLGRKNIRVNCISAGPIKTLAASGISDFRYILRWNEINSPLARNVTTQEVGNGALYLLSDLSSGVTGEIHYVDAGYNIIGMMSVEGAADNADMLNSFVADMKTKEAETPINGESK